MTFLQGIVTSHVLERFGPKQAPDSTVALNTVLLNPRGRVLFDFLLLSKKGNVASVQPNMLATNQELFLDCDSKVADSLLSQLVKYRVRLKVDFMRYNPELISVVSVLGKGIEDHVISTSPSLLLQSFEKIQGDLMVQLQSKGIKPPSKVITASDPRLPQVLGYRFYLFFNSAEEKQQWNRSLESNIVGSSQHPLYYYSSPDIYNRIRMLCGICEGSEIATDEALPLDYNFDLLHGIDWNKGCYVGQELTARSHFSGQVRKRVFPLYSQARDVLIGQEEKLQFCSIPNTSTDGKAAGRRERSAGKLICRTPDGSLGLGVIRFENVIPKDGHTATQTVAIDSQPLSVVKPFWMSNKDLYPEEEAEEEEEDMEYLEIEVEETEE